MNTIYSTNASERLISQAEEIRAAEYLASSRDDLLQAVAGLSDGQMKWKASPDQWSIAEVIEHVTILEVRVHGLIAGISGAAAAGPDRNNLEIEDLICVAVPCRDTRIQAPSIVRPSGQLSPAESIENFSSTRAQTIHLLATAPSLRGHVVRHPILGFWDGYQWILATAAHNHRHNHQIIEIKSQFGPAAVT